MYHYLTTPFSVDFNVNTTPSFTRQVNGMSTKTNAVRHALDCQVISRVKDIATLPKGDLIIEPLFFKSHPDSVAEDDSDLFQDRLKAIQTYAGRKMLLCSEMTPLRWTGEAARKIFAEMEYVFASCRYQSDLLKAIDVEVNKVVYEPVNEFLFYPCAEKQNWVVAVGSPTHVKNTEAVIDVFSKLSETSDLKTIFIGSPIVWAKITNMKYETSFDETMKNLERLKEVCDIYYTASSQIFISYILSKAKYYVNFAYHETCCRTAMEALLSGVGILAGKHPVFTEYPCIAHGLTSDECVELLLSEPAVDSESIRNWALSHVSYAAFRKSFSEVLQQ